MDSMHASRLKGDKCSRCGGPAPGWKCPKCGQIFSYHNPFHWKECRFGGRSEALCQACNEAESKCACVQEKEAKKTEKTKNMPENNKTLYHIMFLPVFGGSFDADLWLNLATVIVFFGIYFWHVKHDHAHQSEEAKRSEELLSEVKKIREGMGKSE